MKYSFWKLQVSTLVQDFSAPRTISLDLKETRSFPSSSTLIHNLLAYIQRACVSPTTPLLFTTNTAFPPVFFHELVHKSLFGCVKV